MNFNKIKINKINKSAKYNYIVHHRLLRRSLATGEDERGAASTLFLKGYAYEQTFATQIIAGDTGYAGIATNESIITSVGGLMPNLVSDGKTRLNISSKNNSEFLANVMNGLGELVALASQKILMGKNVLNIDFSGLSRGTYFRTIPGNKSSTVFRKLTIAG